MDFVGLVGFACFVEIADPMVEVVNLVMEVVEEGESSCSLRY